MDVFVVLGVVVAALVFSFSINDLTTNPASYFQLESIIMVVGGVFASTVIMSSAKDMKRLFKVFRILIFQPKMPTPEASVKELIALSEMYHKGGRMSLEGKGDKLGDGFLGRGIQMVIDKIDAGFVRLVIENEIYEIQKRHNQIIKMFRSMSSFAPMFGLIGTVVGIIQVLKSLQDPQKIGPAMSLALLTSFYGLFLSSVIFLPIANKLKKRSEEELLTKEIIKEGVILIAQGEIPLKVERYLHAYLDRTAKGKAKKG